MTTSIDPADPKGLNVDDYMRLMMELIQAATTAAYGIPTHVTLFVGTRIQEVKQCSTLSDDQLLSLLAAFSEAMALKHTPTHRTS